MAATDSRYAGVLKSTGASGIHPVILTLRKFISEVTGIEPSKVRQKWYQRAGTMPSVDTDWCLVSVNSVKTHGTPYQHDRKGQFDDIVRTSHQTIEITASFFGSNAELNADTFRESILVDQNNAWLKSNGITIQDVVDDVLYLPQMVAENWIDVYSVRAKVGRRVDRIFKVLSITSSNVELQTEKEL